MSGSPRAFPDIGAYRPLLAASGSCARSGRRAVLIWLTSTLTHALSRPGPGLVAQHPREGLAVCPRSWAATSTSYAQGEGRLHFASDSNEVGSNSLA
eukprot:56908-Pyramimonas_sp.AAC.1